MCIYIIIYHIWIYHCHLYNHCLVFHRDVTLCTRRRWRSWTSGSWSPQGAPRSSACFGFDWLYLHGNDGFIYGIWINIWYMVYGLIYFIYIDTGGWFGTMEFYDFPFSEFHHPNWRTPSFFRGVGIPPTRTRFGISMYNNSINIIELIYH